METKTVPVKSAWKSKINGIQVIALIATVLATFGFDITPEQQAAIVAAIGVVGQLMTWIIRTWFTKAVTKASVAGD